MMNLGIFCLWKQLHGSPVRTSAFQSCGGEIGRAMLNLRPGDAPRPLRCAGEDFVNHDGVERAVNYQGARDGQHHIAMPNESATHHHRTGERG